MESIALRIEPGLYVVARGPLPKGATALLDPDCLRCEFHGAGETSSVSRVPRSLSPAVTSMAG